MTKLENSIEGSNIKLGQAEERISEHKDKSIEIILSEVQKERRLKMSEENLHDLCDTIKRTNL